MLLSYKKLINEKSTPKHSYGNNDVTENASWISRRHVSTFTLPPLQSTSTIANHAVTHSGGKVVDNHSHVIPLLATSILDLFT